MPAITGISHVDLSVTDLEASTAWYVDLLGCIPLFGGRSDPNKLDAQYIMEPNSQVVIGLEQHDENPGRLFDERQVGLDHLSFNVASREELDVWLATLEEKSIPNTGITVEDNWDVLVLRDPDNIQLEFIFLKIGADDLDL